MAVPSVMFPASASPQPVPLPIPNSNPLSPSVARASGRTRPALLAARLRGVPRAAFTGYSHGDTPTRSGDVASPQYISTMESVNSRPMQDYADDQSDAEITSPMFHCDVDSIHPKRNQAYLSVVYLIHPSVLNNWSLK